MERSSWVFLLLLILLTAAPGAYSAEAEHALIFDLTPARIQARFGKAAGTALDPAALDRLASRTKNVGDSFRIVVVPVEWSGRTHTYSTSTLDSQFFSRHVYPGGSVADYFYEVSYGRVLVSGTVLPWQDGGQFDLDYDFETMLPGLDSLVDFTQYDGNSDGSVDAIVFLRAGTGEEDTHDPTDMWSYAMLYDDAYPGPGPFDGVYIYQYNTVPELRPLHDTLNPALILETDTLNSIRVVCHELGHNMGLPDLYDYDDKLVTATYNTPGDYNDHPVYDWCLMGYGGYGIFSIKGHQPPHLSGWSKAAMGWLTPIEAVGNVDNLVIYDIEAHSDSCLYRVTITDHRWEGYTEYFLLEFRNPRSPASFDKTDSDFSSWFASDLAFGADTLDRGLLITHVNEGVSGYWDNDGTPNHPDYRVAVEDAGYDPARDETYNPEGRVTDSAQWWYPWETRKGALFSSEVPFQNEFSPTTTPNSDRHGHDSYTGITIRVDSILEDRLYVSIENPLDFDADNDSILDWLDNCRNDWNPDQEDSDGDSYGNACDLCPDLYELYQFNHDLDTLGDGCDNCPWWSNNDQADADGDDVGDVCDNCPSDPNPGQADWNGNGIGDICEDPSCCTGQTGNVSGDAEELVNLTDLTTLVNHLFVTFEPLSCPQEANTSGDAQGSVTLTDLTVLVNHLFVTFDPIANCPSP